MGDTVHFQSGLKAGLAAYAPPRHPCPICGKETGSGGSRQETREGRRTCQSCSHSFVEAAVDNVLKFPQG